jgi:hypothetical protein
MVLISVPFCGSRNNRSATGIDGLLRDGAARLADVIKKYWREQGAEVVCEVVPIRTAIARKNPKAGGAPKPDDSKCTVWGVRSNLIDGVPVAYTGRPAAAD